jgi:hypothetical protein
MFEALAIWNGKSTQPLRALYPLHKPLFPITIPDLESDMEWEGYLWLLKHSLEQGELASIIDLDHILLIINKCNNWGAKLLWLQICSLYPISLNKTQKKTVTIWCLDENKTVKTWAYYILAHTSQNASSSQRLKLKNKCLALYSEATGFAKVRYKKSIALLSLL